MIFQEKTICLIRWSCIKKNNLNHKVLAVKELSPFSYPLKFFSNLTTIILIAICSNFFSFYLCKKMLCEEGINSPQFKAYWLDEIYVHKFHNSHKDIGLKIRFSSMKTKNVKAGLVQLNYNIHLFRKVQFGNRSRITRWRKLETHKYLFLKAVKY